MKAVLKRYGAALGNYRLHWRARWRHSVARRWLQAWCNELLGMLPAALAGRISRRGETQLLDWPLPEGGQDTRPAVLLLAEHQVMLQHISLPLVATRNLNEVLAYELDKYTPYPPAQVHFVARVLQRYATHAEIELVAIARTALDTMLQACRARDLQLLAIDVVTRDARRLGIDLLPADSETRRSSPGQLNRWLGLGCVLSVVAVGAACLDQRRATVVAMQQAVNEQRQAVRAVQQLRQALDTTVGAAHYLGTLKAKQPTLTAVLADLSACLGEDTWLERLQLEDGVHVTVSGQSTNASELLNAVKGCNTLEDARFQGVILADKASGRDRFAISARLKEADHAPTHP